MSDSDNDQGKLVGLEDIFRTEHFELKQSTDVTAQASMDELKRAFDSVIGGLKQALKEDKDLHCDAILKESANLELIGSVYGWAGGAAVATGYPLAVGFGEIMSLIATGASLIHAEPGVTKARKHCESIKSRINAHELTRDILLKEIGKEWQKGHGELSGAKQKRQGHKNLIRAMDAKEFSLRKQMYAINPVGRAPSPIFRAFAEDPSPSDNSIRRGATYFASAVPIH